LRYLILPVFFLFFLSCSLSEIFTKIKVEVPESGYTKIDLVLEDLVFIKAKVNGVDGLFLFDNGFTNCALNTEFAEKCNLKFTGKRTVNDANNQKTTFKDGEIQVLTIGDFVFKNPTFHEINTKNFLPCFPFDGVIGGNVIKQVNWRLNFENKKIEIQELPFVSDGIVWPITTNSNNSSFVKFNWNEEEVDVHVDFGKQGEISFKLEQFRNNIKGYPADLVVGITSLSATGLGKADTNYNIPGAKLNFSVNQNKVMPFDEVSFEKGLKREGRIGVGYFKKYNQVVLNSTKNQIVLNGFNPTTDDDSFKSYGLGIYLIEGEFKLIQIQPNNPNFQQLNLMDKVEEINNKPTRRFKTICDYKNFVKEIKATQVPLIVKFENIPNYLEFRFQQPYLEPIK